MSEKWMMWVEEEGERGEVDFSHLRGFIPILLIRSKYIS
jgi:hypothetical protein